MKRLHFFAILLAALTCCFMESAVHAAQAVELKYYGIEGLIYEDLSVENTVTLRFSESITHLDYHLDFRIQNLTAISNFSSSCSVADREGGSTISCDFVGMPPSEGQLVLNFVTKDIIKQMGGNYQFSVNYGVSLPITRAFTLIRLPANNVLAGDVANMSYFPQNGRTITDGKHIMVYWESDNMTSGSSLQFSVLFSKPAVVSDTALLALVAALIVVMVVVALMIRRKAPAPASPTSVLNQDEKAVVDILAKNEGKALQKVLVRDTGFSKAKISRLIKSLRERGVIDIEPVSGRENRIILKLKV